MNFPGDWSRKIRETLKKIDNIVTFDKTFLNLKGYLFIQNSVFLMYGFVTLRRWCSADYPSFEF